MGQGHYRHLQESRCLQHQRGLAHRLKYFSVEAGRKVFAAACLADCVQMLLCEAGALEC